jgi:hypothetical protein
MDGKDGGEASREELPGRPGEPGGGRAGQTIGEAVGEPRTYAWLEMVAVDARGAPAGPVRRLTPTSGHVSSFDLLLLRGSPKLPLLVVARDDGEAIDGTGGALLRIRAGEDGAEAPLDLPSDGLGRGAPALVGGGGTGTGVGADAAEEPWLAWAGGDEGLRLLPLDEAGTPVGPVARPSIEDAVGAVRPLLVLARGADVTNAAGGDPAAREMLVARPVPVATDPAARAPIAPAAAEGSLSVLSAIVCRR